MTTSPATKDGRLKGRIALITGASRGIGAAVAKAFAREGAQLILAARTVGGLEEIDDAIQEISGRPATLVPLDLMQFDSIDQLGASLYERFGRLDVLVGNAGILGTLSPTSHIDPKTWQRVIDVNLTANYRLIRSLEPLLKLSAAGRAIFVTSGAARGVRPYWGAYAVSKAGLEALVRNWSGELMKTNVKVNLLDPGGTRTAMRAAAYPTEDASKLKTPEEIADRFVELAAADCQLHGETVSLA
jgi:NAD(P)-dependent dehydrogenase (short-subunit alcohol dehydrogenase family)